MNCHSTPRLVTTAAVTVCLAALGWFSSWIAAGAPQEGEYSVAVLEEAAPDVLSEAVRGALAETGLRVTGPQGVIADVWFVQPLPSRPNFRPGFDVKYPFTAGELIGAIRFPESGGHDFRGQEIDAGVYTLRYGQQPVDGNHIGTSPTRDFLVPIPADLDTSIDALAQTDVEELGKMTTGTTHPAILFLMPPIEERPAEPVVRHDTQHDFRVLTVDRPGDAGGEEVPVSIDLVVEGQTDL